MAKTKSKPKRKYTCKRCNLPMSGPSSHRNGCPGEEVSPEALGALVDAALDAVKAELKDGRKKRNRVASKVKKAVNILNEVIEELEA